MAKWHFITSDKWAPNADNPSFGALAFIYGTFVVSFIGVVLAVPLSLSLALFVSEVVPGRVRGIITMLTDLLAAIPSVVFGLWGIAVLAPNIDGVYSAIHDVVGWIPLIGTMFGPNAQGRSFMTAGIILAIMITPIVTSVMREVLLTVPATDKDGALALGATRWEMIREVVLPHTFGGLVGGVMLGLGRAMGETIAVALTIGASAEITGNLFKSGDAMPAVIVNLWGEATGTYRSALMALGVVLFLMTIVVNVGARTVVARAAARMGGS